jgi:hypothetical protein
VPGQPSDRIRMPVLHKAVTVGGNAMDNSLTLIDNKTLCLIDNEGNILVQHKPLWTEFKQFKRIKENCIIVKEADNGFPITWKTRQISIV